MPAVTIRNHSDETHRALKAPAARPEGRPRLGSGMGLALVQLARRPLGVGATEAPLRHSDLPWLALVVLAGGVAGPVLLMFGLARASAATNPAYK